MSRCHCTVNFRCPFYRKLIYKYVLEPVRDSCLMDGKTCCTVDKTRPICGEITHKILDDGFNQILYKMNRLKIKVEEQRYWE